MLYHHQNFGKSTPPQLPLHSLDDAFANHGSINHPYIVSMLDQAHLDAIDIADIAHFLCLLHGRYPGLIDFASTHCAKPEARQWLSRCREAFIAERGMLTHLTVAAGPVTGTAGQDQCTPAILALRSALNNLSQSDRKGCAIGAALALVIDWHDIRQLLQKIGTRLYIELDDSLLASPNNSYNLARQLASGPALQRAIGFGASQMLRQHQQFWDMLAKRRDLRNNLDH